MVQQLKIFEHKNLAQRYWKGNDDISWLEKFKRLRLSSALQPEKDFYLNKFKSCLGNKRQVYKLINVLSAKVMNSSKVPVQETVANSISQPNAHDNAIAFINYLPMLGLKSASISVLKMNRSSKTSTIDASV